MNSNTLVNRIEIGLYSMLISVMGGINRLRGKDRQTPPVSDWPFLDEEIQPDSDQSATQHKAISISWEAIKVALLALVLWLVLGFAAGFLIGMIKPW